MLYSVTLYLSDSIQSTYSGENSRLAHLEAIGLAALVHCRTTGVLSGIIVSTNIS